MSLMKCLNTEIFATLGAGKYNEDVRLLLHKNTPYVFLFIFFSS
ncbi:hypothetical protein Q648_01338 [Bartonella quintana JK 12]|uniref:Uncharacterized protein n=1 Tax=Bartonella quintana JK 73 TaxID=1402976 RepID=W3TUX0_BARQI|nr:hypothetical protein Q651_00928 [Bartonella quintana BQ2-D70]ETS12931.1 hypothetical protein Q650_01356 [Bartonella quintana JK 73rel]ETS15047.1 hypothetical protein Q649_01357 [Bartonella quintana JK 73]ETS16520.1 hypothetical protein Q648_01338 [Bartonella quintana JK 12]ETS17303.1 hypothetical protein Q647_01351 [Bartonella quintana JK 7]KEC57926.1 hypothetical protein O93_01242 [Bartonella quintana JK 19]KEC60933.1 hypothetical protein O7Y_01309 [Bartonella quintana JK 63]KEC61014.1 h